MSEINKIYKFYGPDQRGYIYSEQSQSDKMKYRYHMLSVQDGIPVIEDLGNTIQTLQNGEIKLYPFKKSGSEYETFIKAKEFAEKARLLSRRLERKPVINTKAHNNYIIPKNRT